MMAFFYLIPFRPRGHSQPPTIANRKGRNLAQHYSTCGVSHTHTLQTRTAAVTSLVPYLTK